MEKCLIRLTSQGDLCSQSIDINNCSIGKDASWGKLRMPKINLSDFKEWNCICKGCSFSADKLVNLLFKYPKARIVINYCNVGAVLLTEDTALYYSFDKGLRWESRNLESSLFDVAAKNIGIVKTKLYTYNVFQPLIRLVAFEDEGKIWTISYKGLLSFDDNIHLEGFEENPKLKLSKLVDISQTDSLKINYALAVYEGKEVIVCLDTVENKFVLKEI